MINWDERPIDERIYRLQTKNITLYKFISLEKSLMFCNELLVDIESFESFPLNCAAQRGLRRELDLIELY